MNPDRLYSYPHPIIGLTGGVASGKSSVSSFLRSEDHPLICADDLVHQIYQKKTTRDLLQKIAPQTINTRGIDFKALRKLFFSNQDIKEQIEKCIYAQLPDQFLFNAEPFKDQKYLIYDVPLLFEKKMEKKFDLIVVVYCPRSIQKERLMKRDNITEELAEKMLDAQVDIEEKKKKADYFIDNTQLDEAQVHLKTAAKNTFYQIIKGLT